MGLLVEQLLIWQKKLNIKVIERKIKLDELKNFSGCFLTGTAAEVTPVSKIDNVNFKIPKVINQLWDDYSSLVRTKKVLNQSIA